MLKHPAWAAPINSSGFVIGTSSTRDLSENSRTSPARPSFIDPVPAGTVPFQIALACFKTFIFTLPFKL
jgi:hypothetical protein